MDDAMFVDETGAGRLEAERAISEFRAARPVFIRPARDGAAVLAFPVEGLTTETVQALARQPLPPRIVVPGMKVRAGIEWDGPVAAVSLAPFTIDTLEEFLDYRAGGEVSGQPIYSVSPGEPARTEIAALALSSLAFLLPAAVVADARSADANRASILSVSADAILSYRDREAASLEIVSRAVVPLDGAGDCEFVIFRGGDGFRDQVAVIVGAPSPGAPVLVRLHSACLTGDIFGSLKCDCGDQLRGTVRTMAANGGGVVLYLDQEGRGNGLANKIRAYNLQAEGHDTFDADALLGFGADQRRFDFAAAMLRQLGFTSIRLMTNNPAKIEALKQAGLDVVSTHRVLTRGNVHNVEYLAAKRDKAGHLFDVPNEGETGLDATGLASPAHHR